MRSLRASCITLAAILIAAPAGADEYYFTIIFGSQSEPKQLRYTHTWAAFVKAVGTGPDLNAYALEVNTISWLPRTLEVKVLRPCPEPGVNLDLDQSFDAVYRNGESVTMWGPFVSRPDIYAKSLQVVQFLNSGQARYRAIDGPLNLDISDCIHAVAAVDPVYGRGHYPLIRIGKPASRYIAEQIVSRSLDDQYLYDNSWLIPRLGLDRYPMEIIPPQQVPRRDRGLCHHPHRGADGMEPGAFEGAGLAGPWRRP